MSLGSRYLNQFQLSLEKDTVILEGSFAVNSGGGVIEYQGGGIASVEQTATGTYDITLEDGWNYLFEVHGQVIRSTASDVAVVQLLMDPTTLQDDIKNKVPLTILCLDYAKAAVDPEDDAVVRFKVLVRRSAVGPFDDGYQA